MRSIVAVCLLAFTLSACSGATPTPAQVPVTVEVTRIVTIPVTVVVTATPVPTDVPAPTATAKPKPPIPIGWKTYTLIDGSLSFAYPPDWTIFAEDADNVALSNGLESIHVVADLLPVAPANERIRRLKTFLAASYPLGQVTFRTENSTADFPNVTAQIRTPGQSLDDLVSISYVTNGQRAAYVGNQAMAEITDANRLHELDGIVTQISRSATFAP